MKAGRIFVDVRLLPSSSSQYKTIQLWLTYNIPCRTRTSNSCAASTMSAKMGMRRLTQPPRKRCEMQFSKNRLKRRGHRSSGFLPLPMRNRFKLSTCLHFLIRVYQRLRTGASTDDTYYFKWLFNISLPIPFIPLISDTCITISDSALNYTVTLVFPELVFFSKPLRIVMEIRHCWLISLLSKQGLGDSVKYVQIDEVCLGY